MPCRIRRRHTHHLRRIRGPHIRLLAFIRLRQSEVEHLRIAVRRYLDVGGLQITLTIGKK